MKSKNSAEQLLLEMIKLEPVEFFGVCKILGVSLYEGEAKIPRDFYSIWDEICDVVEGMNRTRRRNLAKLIYPATKKEKK